VEEAFGGVAQRVGTGTAHRVFRSLMLQDFEPLGWNNVEGFLRVCYGSWGQKGCFSVNSMREFADLPPKARRIMIANMTKAHQLLIDNLAAARGVTDDNESMADLIITFFCGICQEQNLGPDRTQITKKIEAFMQLIRRKG
jgi:hypothetical protein